MYGLVALTLQDLRISLLEDLISIEAAEVIDDLAAGLHSLSQLETLGLRAERRLHTPDVRDALVRLAAKAAAMPSLRKVRLPWPLTSRSMSKSGNRVRRTFVALREAKPDFAVVPIESRVDGSYGLSSFPSFWPEDDGGGGSTEADEGDAEGDADSDSEESAPFRPLADRSRFMWFPPSVRATERGQFDLGPWPPAAEAA